MKIIDHYKILGLENKKLTLTEEELSKRYRELTRIYHPDVNKETSSVEKFMQIKESYEKLREDLKQKKNFNFSQKSEKSENSENYSQNTQNFGFKDFKSQAHNNNKDSTITFKTQEEYIFYLIFGYIHETDPDKFFLKENKEKRKKFREQVFELRNNPEDLELSDEEFIRKAFITEFKGMGMGGFNAEQEGNEFWKKALFSGVVIAAFFGVFGVTLFEYFKNVISTFFVKIFIPSFYMLFSSINLSFYYQVVNKILGRNQERKREISAKRRRY